MKHGLNSALGEDLGSHTLDTLAEFINTYADTTGKELLRLRELCVRYSESDDNQNWMALQKVLNGYPMRLRVFATKEVNGGRPTFAYMSAKPARAQPATVSLARGADAEIREYIAEVQLPSMIVKLLQKMQDGQLTLLRQCEYCGAWMHARGKNVRWCPVPKRCKYQFYEKTPAGRAANAKRQRENYQRNKLMEARAKALARGETHKP